MAMTWLCTYVFYFLEPIDGDIRLVDGKTKYEGRIEIYYRGRWGTICDDKWRDSKKKNQEVVRGKLALMMKMTMT